MTALPARALTRAVVLVGLAVTVWCLPFLAVRASEGAHTTGDEPFYLMTAQSLADDHDLDVADERASGAYRPYHEIGLLTQEAVRPDGSRLSPHNPLLPALLAPATAVGGWVLAKAMLAVTAGLLAGAMVWVAVRRFAVPVGVAVVTVLGFSLAAPLAVYGTQVYPEVPAALAVTLAIGAVTAPAGHRGALVLAVGAIAALPWLSVKYAPVAAALAAVLLVARWRAGHRRAALAAAGALAALGAAYLALHHAWYGGFTPYAAGAHFEGGQLTVMGSDPDHVGRALRLVGLLVDRSFGLVVWAPLFLLAVVALGALARRRPPGWLALVVPLAAGWLNATFVALTMHGWWWPGRQVVVVVPCLVLAVAWAAARLPALRPLVAAGGVVGAATALWLLVEGLLERITLVVTFEQTANPLVAGLRLLLPDYRALDAWGWVRHLAWIAALAALAAWGWRAARDTPAAVPEPAPAEPGSPGSPGSPDSPDRPHRSDRSGAPSPGGIHAAAR